ncbi:hypothetical protein HU200_005816 [Digitaria exilis]|uniref:T-complex protein 11 n=1 Tax=Digitaria exilis TaxID=1010633 RepID=A0A835FR07_9POAL|nr:hypothetical protein HU200_005816 [Digitaria exilis]CAB3487103.1 unnamed protein product [Digitaria exilis]
MESAAVFIKELELLTKTMIQQGRFFSAQPLAGFDKAWCAYLYRFVAWKVKDAKVLEEDLVRAACKLELSMMQTCKLTTADGQPPSDLNLTHDMKAIRQQVADDQKLLREKVQQLSGDAGVERMDSAISDARSHFFQAKKKNGSPAATPPPVANVSTPLMSTDSSSAAQQQTTENEQMVNEMLHMDDTAFGASKSDGAGTAEKDFKKKVTEAMENAFWDMVTDSTEGDKPDYSQLVSLIKEVKDSLQELAPKQWKEEIADKIDLEILSQVLGSGSQDAQYLGQILQYSLDMVRKRSAAAKEDEMKKSHEKLLNELAASSQGSDNGGSSAFVIAVIKGLRFILEEIKELRAEVSKARIQIAMQPIVKGTTGVEYLQKAFTDRYGPPAKASESLPLTLQWISTLKSVAEQEWSEHVASLSTVPSAVQAAPAIVHVLRAGHGASSAGQPSSLPAAAASGQPECKGERLDKLVRVGLLQLVSSMEGLQMQSTPECFHINLMRLRAVQSHFQQVIVIATSMLILRQVLMAESPKATPAELENATSELFKNLMKILDGSPDAGTEEIVEAMVAASASVGGSPSVEKVQARRQMIGRVLLKSLQPGDAVFKMVSRAVHCAFRGVVLGGSSTKGQKLADAALRRVGAVKLVDREVEAAEVVIKVATVSEKVHGPWYTALM